MKKQKTLLCLLALLLLMVSCKSGVPTEREKPLIYTSFYPIYDLCSTLAGEYLDIRCFLPTDKDPHLWEPTPKDLQRLSEADLLIVNGANMERWLDAVENTLPDLPILRLSDNIELITYKGAAAIGDFSYMARLDLSTETYSIEFGHTHEDLLRVAFFNNKEGLSRQELIEKGKKTMEKKGKLVSQHSTIDVESEVVYGIEMGHEIGIVHFEINEPGEWIFFSDRVSEEILSYEIVDKNGDILDKEVLLEGSTSGLDKITYDPHSWMSIRNAKSYLATMANELSKKYPTLEKKIKRNRLNAVDELTTLEYQYRDLFKDLRIREFVVSHHAYAYLARDFDIRQFPLQGLTSMEDPSLKTLQKAIDFCRHYDIKIIFYELGGMKKGADTIASELGGETLPLASMEYTSPKQSEEGLHYIDIMRTNLEHLYQSMRNEP